MIELRKMLHEDIDRLTIQEVKLLYKFVRRYMIADIKWEKNLKRDIELASADIVNHTHNQVATSMVERKRSAEDNLEFAINKITHLMMRNEDEINRKKEEEKKEK